MRKRAVQPQDKEQRRQAILDAAEGQWLAHPQRVVSVAEVAAAAGVAKGTVYLYFPSKEELLQALFERKVHGFFDALMVRAAAGPLGMEEVLEVVRVRMVEEPGFLDLASLVLGQVGRQLPREAVLAFHQRVAQRLEEAGRALLGHLGSEARATALLNAGYALIVGLWQLRQPVQDLPQLRDEPALAAVTGDYFSNLSEALRALWRGFAAEVAP